MLLFARGLLGIHHVHAMHRLAYQEGAGSEARDVLEKMHEAIDSLPPEKARGMLELLAEHYGGQ